MRKRIFPLIAIFLTAGLLSACTLEVSTLINDDESGVFAIALSGAEDEVDEMAFFFEFGGIGSHPEDWCDYLEDEGLVEFGLEDFPFEPEIEYQEDRDTYICTISFEFNDLDELNEMFEDDVVFVIDHAEIEDNVFSYEASFEMSDFEVLESSFQMAGVDVEMEYLWVVTAPGSITEHNGDSQDGNSVTWELRPGRSNNFDLESSMGFSLPFGLPTWTIALFCLCCLSFLVIIVVLILFMRKRNKKAE